MWMDEPSREAKSREGLEDGEAPPSRGRDDDDDDDDDGGGGAVCKLNSSLSFDPPAA